LQRFATISLMFLGWSGEQRFFHLESRMDC